LNHQDTKTPRVPIPAEVDRVATVVVNSAYRVHKQLGPGLLESVYEACLARELELLGLTVKRQVVVPVQYADIDIDAGFRLDLCVENCVIVELKAVESVLPIHRAQVLTYLRLTGIRLGLLINFNVILIRDGIKRIAC